MANQSAELVCRLRSLPHLSDAPHTPSLPYRMSNMALCDDSEPHENRCTCDSIGDDLRKKSRMLTDDQNYDMRSSPPIQPGEQSTQKLPSFNEFIHGVARRAHTPPDTPSRRNESNHSSPHVKPVFEDVAWHDGHRRNDTLGDIYAQHPARLAEPLPLDQRRMSSAIESQQLPVSVPMQHRQSLSYPPPPAPGPSGSHYQHHASHSSLSHPSYHQLSLNAPAPFAPPAHHSAVYDHRTSQYHSAQRSSHPYPHQDQYYRRGSYAGPPPPGYETGYNDIRFQQHVGVDANSFNRKRRGNLPKEATAKLKRWYDDNKVSPYPNEEQKIQLCNATSLTLAQVSNWFINARRRNPQREAREEKREAEQAKKA